MDLESEHLKRKRTDLMIRKAKNTGGEKAEKKFSRTMSNDNLPKSLSYVLLGLTNYMALSSIVTQQAKYYWILVL